MSISPSQLGRIYSAKECTYSYKINVLNLPLDLGVTKFLPSKKVITSHPLNQGPAIAMKTHLDSHEELLSSMSWIYWLLMSLYLWNLFIGHISSINFIHESCILSKSDPSIFSSCLASCHVALLQIIILPRIFHPSIWLSTMEKIYFPLVALHKLMLLLLN